MIVHRRKGSVNTLRQNGGSRSGGEASRMESRWSSPAQVAADLARAGAEPPRAAALLAPGRRLAPPRALRDRELAEGLAQLDAADAPSGAGGPAREPDLRGITHMLRMIRTDVGGEAGDPDTDRRDDLDAVICKPPREGADREARSSSLLDPEVPAFVPRSAAAPAGDRGREELAERLRASIAGPRGAGDPSPYVAIAHLMRLFSSPEPVAPLLTPAYFERPPGPGRAPPPPSAGDDEDPLRVRASIDKVTVWLEGRDPGAPARLVEAPPAFRARPREAAASPPLASSRAASPPRAYVPSAAAAALRRQYAERAAARAEGAGGAEGPLWGRLEEELRRRDAAAAAERTERPSDETRGAESVPVPATDR